MNPILSALQSGYTPDKILKYISKIDPDLAIKINTALQAGHSIDKVLGYLSQMGNKISGILGQGTKQPENLYKKAQTSVHPFIGQVGQYAGLAGAGALGTFALSRALPQAAQSLVPEIAAAPKPPVSPIPQMAQEALSKNAPEIGKELIAKEMQQIPSEQITPEIQTQKKEISIPLPEIMQEKVKNMLSAGNSAQDIAGALKTIFPKDAKEYEKTTGIQLTDAVKKFSKEMAGKAQLPEKAINADVAGIGQEPNKEPEKVEKNKLVALPDGTIGTIQDIRKGIAEVNSEGKIRRRKASELIESPLPQKELHELYDDLKKGIELKTGQELSRMANLLGFDPKNKSLVYHPVGSKSAVYVYDDLTDAEIEELKTIEQLRRTSGENYIGAWKQGTKSVIGSKLHDFIAKLQAARGGKGQEYSYKFETFYDALGPAKEEAEAAKKAKKAEENYAKKEEKRIESERRKEEKRKAKKPRPS